MWAVWIVLGVLIGLILAFWFIFWLHARTKTSNASNGVYIAAEKLVMARKYFGLIANRESIGEARKIANKALKELQK